MKKECATKIVSNAAAPLHNAFDNIIGAEIISSSGENNYKHFLRKLNNPTNNEIRPKTAVPIISSISSTSDPIVPFEHDNNTIFTKCIVDSLTISLPIPSPSTCIKSPPKYKTMPSPTRSNTILPETKCLNEIFEEGTDVGSSDTSTTTTPRPIARHHCSNLRSNNHSPSTNSAQRRSKLHKSRTASCSSSDDDDSENRKKRTQKIEDSTKVFQSQRRDSHDDSSDSQDPSNNAAGSTNSNSSGLVSYFKVSSKADNQTDDHNSKQTNDTSNSRQKTGQPIGFRKTRAGRRRAGETRLRESQSLNRITEVQESEFPLSTINTPSVSAEPYNNETDTMTSNATISMATAISPTTSHKLFSIPKSNKIGFKFFHGFRKSSDSSTKIPPKENKQQSTNKSQTKFNQPSNWKSNRNNSGNNDIKFELDAQKSNGSHKSSTAKKLKMLGKYFQVSIYYLLNNIIFTFENKKRKKKKTE